MVSLAADFLGIRSPNPFWLASAPPTDKAYNVVRAFREGWGGVVWKTLGEDPAIVNVNGPRYGAIHGPDRRLMGFNNIELITDRPLHVNLREIKEVKRDWPDRAMVVSLMVPCEEANWAAILPLVEATGADGIELNFGCPHGMSERGMGSAVGQVPEYIEMVARWCKAHTRMPVIVKLTPNITDVRYPARAARKGGADAVSLINTISSITSVNLDTFSPEPSIDGKGSHGGYCGPAVKPIALNMVAEIARDSETRGMPISGIGGITTWRDAAEFMALGCGNVQVCTAAMAYGFKIVREMISGLERWMDEKGYVELSDFVGLAAPNVTDWQYLNLNYVTKALIHQDLCIKCGRCHIACEDTSHQAITHIVDGRRHFEVIDAECVGCNLCVEVCPVENCITMEALPPGAVDPRTGHVVEPFYANWTSHPNNPMAAAKNKQQFAAEPMVREPAE
ncbi:MAG: NAD-dependent dihydropyrimidine dehydrogenase subunit PreA [Pseudomonadota bacterium]|nr:NAD-dependent dihydropyrimidine dehydrogenase subunit PreA [Pseudomonadota bacterium]